MFVKSRLNLNFFPTYNVELNYSLNKYMLKVISDSRELIYLYHVKTEIQSLPKTELSNV